MKITIPKPTLFTNSDSMYSLTEGWSFGTKIIVTIVEIIHFMKEIKLKEKPFKKHWRIQYEKIRKVTTSNKFKLEKIFKKLSTI